MTIAVQILNQDTDKTRSVHVVPLQHGPTGVAVPGVATVLEAGQAQIFYIHSGLSLSVAEVDSAVQTTQPHPAHPTPVPPRPVTPTKTS